MTKLSEKSTIQIKKSLDQLIGNLHSNIGRICDHLTELARREVHVSLMDLPMFRYHAKVSAGLVDPKTLICFGGDDHALLTAVKLPVDAQNEINQGQKIPVAVHNHEGKIECKNMSFLYMTHKERELVVGRNGLRLFSAQKRLVGMRKPRKHRSNDALRVAADIAKQEIIVGQMRIKPRELSKALRQLGFELKRIEKKKAA